MSATIDEALGGRLGGPPGSAATAYAAYDAVMIHAASILNGTGTARAAADYSGALGDVSLDPRGDLKVPNTHGVWSAPGARGGQPARLPDLAPGINYCSIALAKSVLDFGSTVPGQPSPADRQVLTNTGTLPLSSVRLTATPWLIDGDPGRTLPAALAEMRTAGQQQGFAPFEEGAAIAQGLDHDESLEVWWRLNLSGHARIDGSSVAQYMTYVAGC